MTISHDPRAVGPPPVGPTSPPSRTLTLGLFSLPWPCLPFLTSRGTRMMIPLLFYPTLARPESGSVAYLPPGKLSGGGLGKLSGGPVRPKLSCDNFPGGRGGGGIWPHDMVGGGSLP